MSFYLILTNYTISLLDIYIYYSLFDLCDTAVSTSTSSTVYQKVASTSSDIANSTSKYVPPVTNYVGKFSKSKAKSADKTVLLFNAKVIKLLVKPYRACICCITFIALFLYVIVSTSQGW